ncbi:hypothetical protein K402DRAFT_398947 [Aulographum hederae CBS 113979]|uniref:Uncharacterized protein n=1 Tax=Aulographum hederae CBS 113979 TaxID=1176131 RepID=A0A6G1GJL9_9PEZI|nr:hypothetical protein K402DRAFT_398947 [Aulographum hederae CBS 113979]
MSSSSGYYGVWKLRFSLALQDPDMQGTRYHTTIFIETEANKVVSYIMLLETSPPLGV